MGLSCQHDWLADKEEGLICGTIRTTILPGLCKGVSWLVFPLFRKQQQNVTFLI